MKDTRLVNLRSKAEADPKLSNGAYRLLSLLISQKYNDPNFYCENEFPLPWSAVPKLMRRGISRRQADRYIRELRSHYLKFEGVRGCPGTAHFLFVLSCAKNGATGDAKNGAHSCAKKGADHISIAFQAKNVQKGVHPKALAAQGRALADAMRKAVEESSRAGARKESNGD